MKDQSIIPSRQEAFSVAPARKLNPMLAAAGAARTMTVMTSDTSAAISSRSSAPN